MIGVYIRVSSQGQNIAGQKREIQQWLDGHGLKDVQWFIDKASGKSLKRPQFEKLQAAVFKGEINTVVVWKLDRLSRNLRDGINLLAEWCEAGLRVVSVTQMLDFSGAMGKMVAALLFSVSEMENELRKERQQAGIQAAKARGVYLGRKSGTFKGNPSRAAELRANGLTDTEIAQAMGVSRSTVQRYLKAAKSTA